MPIHQVLGPDELTSAVLNEQFAREYTFGSQNHSQQPHEYMSSDPLPNLSVDEQDRGDLNEVGMATHGPERDLQAVVMQIC